MSEIIDIDKESGELIIQHMETVLAFRNWTLLGAIYDERRQCVRGFFSHDEDTNVQCYFLKMKEDGKLIAYNGWAMPPGAFIQYLKPGKVPGFVMTKKQERIKKVFDRVMTPELAMELVEAGVKLEAGD
jgi:hypothetical protein